MSEENKVNERSGNYDMDFRWLLFLPIIITVGLIPLITRLEFVEVGEEVFELFGQQTVSDFFSQYKSIYIIGVAVVMGIMTILTFDKKEIKNEKWVKISVYGIGAYWIATAISTMLSEHSDVAWWGMFDRAEGFVVITAYMAMFLYTLHVIKRQDEYRLVAFPLAFVVIIIGILGYYQYTGDDLLLNTDWGKMLIVPSQYAEVRDQITPLYSEGNIYGTMYHYNYVGTFAAMAVPFFAILAVGLKDIKAKIGYGAITIISIGILIGSTARSGIIGVVAAAIILLLIFWKQIIDKWKIVVPVIVVGLGAILGANAMTDGALLSRLPSLMEDMFALFLPSNSDFDYKDELPFRGIDLVDKNVYIETIDDMLIIDTTVPSELVITDKDGNEVAYRRSGDEYTIEDSRFNNMVFEVSQNYFMTVGHVQYGLIFVVTIGDPSGLSFLNTASSQPTYVYEAPYVSWFNGKEKLGSARGYIWSRTFPMIGENLLFGTGPDTYVLEFPQEDRLAKMYTYGTANIIVDKPHNLLLQIASNQGIIALIGFCVANGAYVINSLRLYMGKDSYDKETIIGIACLLAVTGFLGAGLFNDSVVSVSPIYWVVFGMGIAFNYRVEKSNRPATQLPKVVKINKE
ncbi:MAG: hypothetical protein ATN35_08890 [Epulopiscium sp. Nele67-Bin004]|nr:MAG: hypothetical protein ATN35_08890 [Epulopiscium sp. Nele67-Bin004]